MEKRRIQELIARHFHGDLDEAGARELSALLRTEEWVRDEFLKSGEIDGRLMWEYGKLADVRQEQRTALWRRSATVLAMAAALVGLLVVANLFNRPDAPPAPQASTPGNNLVLAVARVIQQEQATWSSHEDRGIKTGEWLLPETYQLETGKVTLAFDGGSTVQVQGPASFTLINAQLVQLQRGRVQARVIESAKGFTVLTPEGKVIDLGTEFYVDVAPSGRTDVGVIEGLVETVNPRGDVRQLKARQKLILADGKQTQLRLKDAPKLDAEYRFSGAADYYHWGFDQREESPDPGTGESKWVYPETGINLQPGRLPLSEAASHEEATSPRPVQGVFGQAVEFTGDGGFLVSSYSGVSGSKPRTVAAWVRIPSDAPPEAAYGWAGWGTHTSYDKAHKWQMCWNPQFKLPEWKQPLSPDAVPGAIRTEFGPGWLIGKTDLRDGQWHHVVSIFIGGDDADVATHVRHYVDGRLEGISGYQSQKIDTWTDKPRSWPLVVGHHLDIPGSYFTGFKGAIDELYVFEGALTPSQVWQLYKENQPPTPGTIPPSLGTLAKLDQ